MNDKNPRNSSLIQHLLDLSAIASISGATDIEQQALELLKSLKTHNSIVCETDKKVSNRRYNQSKMEYVKLKDIIHNQIIFSLSPMASKVLLYCCQSILQDSLVELKIDDLCNNFKTTDKTLKKAIEELKDYGCIVLVKRGSKRNGNGNLYMLNPDICFSGKLSNQQSFDSHVKKIDPDILELYDRQSKILESMDLMTRITEIDGQKNSFLSLS